MNFVEQLDPELKAVMERMPTDRTLDLTKISAARARMKKLVLEMLATFPQVEGVSQEDRFAPGTQGGPPVRVRIYRADDQSSKLPALYWIHGGGYVMGDIDMDDRLMKQMVKRIGCVAASVDYRLAPEHPFPTPVEDCYTGLKWLFAHADELGVEPARIAIGGPSGWRSDRGIGPARPRPQRGGSRLPTPHLPDDRRSERNSRGACDYRPARMES